jgi:hypothetical protein
MKELNTQSCNSWKTIDVTEETALQISHSRSHSKFWVTNLMDGDLMGGCPPNLHLNRQETEDDGVPIRPKVRSFNDMI